MFNVKPPKKSNANVPMIDTGIDVQTMSVRSEIAQEQEDDEHNQKAAHHSVLAARC